MKQALGENSLVVVDFFCGAGGFTRGALDAGAYVLCGIDRDMTAQSTYENKSNNMNCDGSVPKFIEADLSCFEISRLLSMLRPFKNNPILFVGCPPCQPFTNLKTIKNKSEGDKDALTHFINHVVEAKPDYVVVENVPGIRSAKYGTIWADAVIKLQKAKYFLKEDVVNSKDYGVSQNRKRMIMIASKNKMPPWPETVFHDGSYKTVMDAIGFLNDRKLKPGERDLRDELHAAAMLSDTNYARIRSIKKSGGNRLSWPASLQLDCYRNHSGHTDVYGRMDWEKPAPTLTTRFNSLSNGRFGHPEQDRAISLREGALIQSFPKSYRFLGPSQGIRARHIGNAVPPLMSKAIIASIIEHACSERNV